MRRFLLSSFLILGLASCTSKEESPKKSGVVERKDIVQKISLNGSVRGLRQSMVQPGYSGYVGKMYVTVGETVKEGQPLVRVTQTIGQPISEVFPIRAPFAGTVTQILKREGEYVASSTSSSDATNALVVLNDLRELWVDATVPEVDVAKVSIDLPADIRANALPGKKYKGVVRTLSLSPKQSNDRWDRGRVEYPTEIKITETDGALRPGMTVVLDVISAKLEKVLAVRHEFVFKDHEGFFLKDNKGKIHRVETGLSNEELVEIKSGAEEGLKLEMVDFDNL